MLRLLGKHTGYMRFRFYVSWEYAKKTNASHPPLGTTVVLLRFTGKAELY